jgi:hypothetical protein
LTVKKLVMLVLLVAAGYAAFVRYQQAQDDADLWAEATR